MWLLAQPAALAGTPGRSMTVTLVALPTFVTVKIRSPIQVCVDRTDTFKSISVAAVATTWLSVTPVGLLSGMARFGERQNDAVATLAVMKAASAE